jgi:transmembrane sensor
LVQVSTGKVVPAFPIEQLRHDPFEGNADSKAPLAPGVSMQFVAAGEAAVVSTSGEISRHPTVDPDNAVAWRRSRLVFENETLANIAAEFNRYNLLKIRVIGEAAQEHFSGTFNANAPEAVMQVLAADSALQVERIGDEISVRARNESETGSTQSNQDP